MKHFKKIMVLALAGLALASCVNPSKTSEPAGDSGSKTVTIGYTQFPANVDQQRNTMAGSRSVTEWEKPSLRWTTNLR